MADAPVSSRKKKRRVHLPAWAEFVLYAPKTAAHPAVLAGALALTMAANVGLGLPAARLGWVVGGAWALCWVAYTPWAVNRQKKAGTWKATRSTLLKTTSLGQVLAKRYASTSSK